MRLGKIQTRITEKHAFIHIMRIQDPSKIRAKMRSPGEPSPRPEIAQPRKKADSKPDTQTLRQTHKSLP